MAKKQLTEAQKKDRKITIICYAIAIVIAIILLWPQVTEIVGHIQDMENAGALRDQIDQAGSEANQFIENLATIDATSAANDAINDAGNAAGNIGDILNGLERD